MKKKKKWKMPKWMELYKDLITNTGGNDIDDLMNDTGNYLETNLPRAIIIYCVQSQVYLLERLAKEEKLTVRC